MIVLIAGHFLTFAGFHELSQKYQTSVEKDKFCGRQKTVGPTDGLGPKVGGHPALLLRLPIIEPGGELLQ